MGSELEFPSLLALTGICQVLAGRAHEWTVLPDDATLVIPFLAVPACQNAVEDLVLQCILRAFLARLQQVIHTNFHARIRSACAAAPLPSPAWPAAMPIVDVVRTWRSQFTREFADRHGAVDLTKLRIIDRLASPPTTTELARAVGLSRRSLERRFRSATNESILDYRTRERVHYAQDLLRRGMKIEAAGRLAGWKSMKDMYGAFRSVVGSPPSAASPSPNAFPETCMG